MDIGLHDVPTSREIRFAAALKAASIALPEPSLYGQEPWDLIWNVVKEADAVLDQCTPANLRAAGVGRKSDQSDDCDWEHPHPDHPCGTRIERPDIVEIAEAGREWAGAPDGD